MRRVGLVITTILAALAVVTTTAAADPSVVVNVAHRGASAYAPENTIAAFELAAEQGADMFELDVQETRDHELVLMHDTTLSRTTDAETVFPGQSPWRVGDLTFSQIRELDAGSWFGSDFHEPVPSLGETLSAMQGSGLGLLLEIKSPDLYPGIEARVADELLRNPLWLTGNRVVVQSFDWDSMRTFHEELPQVPIGLLGTPKAAELDDLATFADEINPPYADVTPSYVRSVHDEGMQIFTWTLDDPGDMSRMISYGVDGIITNKPDVLSDLAVTPLRRAGRGKAEGKVSKS
ncbi:hydrolase [Planotetraspora phitsanulokensis]|uniref:Hydrolase n=1 Tax=Planotetraspora phitsanulokensis TaxID=575192 RepID=A0A8J3UA42_9ACTN|nr:glycerophosphodiester phosphodiesterase family protein [Planotetraspora phitsanulokensis]GII39616.1 hydrolase [Planotetraspora phitsanulokensis]